MRPRTWILVAVMTFAVLLTKLAARADRTASDPQADPYPANRVWSIQPVTSVGNFSRGSSLALDNLGRPHISYCDVTGSWDIYAPVTTTLKYARWDGNGWIIQTVDNKKCGYPNTSLALDNAGNPHIYDGRLYAYWTGTAWITQTIPGGGAHVSLALDAAGYPHISYMAFDQGNYYIRYATLNRGEWVTSTIEGGDSRWRGYTSLALDNSGNPHISYETDGVGLQYALWTDNAWIIQTVDATPWPSIVQTNLAMDSHGAPHICYGYYYSDGHSDIKYTQWTGDTWTTQIVDKGESCGSLAFDSSGNPHISYASTGATTVSGLRYATWTGNLWVAQNVAAGGTHLGLGLGPLALDKWANPHISAFGSDNSLYYAVGSWPGGFTFIPDSDTGKVEPGGQATHTHVLQNTNNISDTYQLTYSGSQNWSSLVGSVVSGTVGLPGSLALTPGQTAIITVTVSAPTGSAFMGVQDTTIVTATSSISPTLVKHVTDTTFVPLVRVYLPVVVFLPSIFPVSR